jgi:hypothetical protein
MAAPTFVASGNGGPSGGNSTTCAKPTGTTEGDVLYWCISGNDTGSDFAPTLTGWEQVVDQDGENTTRLIVMRKVAGDSEPSTYTFTWVGIQSIQINSMIAVRGADTGTPEAATPTMATGDDDSPNGPASGTVASGDYFALTFFSMQGKRGPTDPPTNYTERIDRFTTGGGPAGNHVGLGIATRELTGITSEDPGVFTTNQGDTWVAGTILVAELTGATIAVNEVAEVEAAVAVAVDTAVSIGVTPAAEVEAAVTVVVDATGPQSIAVGAVAEAEAAVTVTPADIQAGISDITHTRIPGGALEHTFDLPPNVAEGRKMLMFNLGSANMRISTPTVRINGGTVFTLIREWTETFLEPYIFSYTIEAADVGQTQGQFDGAGVSEESATDVITCWVGDVDLTSATPSRNRADGNTSVMAGVDEDTGDTDEKLHVYQMMHSRADVNSLDEVGDTDDLWWGSSDGDNGITTETVGTKLFAALKTSAQTLFGSIAAGDPSMPRGTTGGNQDTITLMVWFDTQDDANWPFDDQVVAVGVASETEAAVAVAADQSIAVGTATEVEAAVVVVTDDSQTVVVTAAAEVEAATAITVDAVESIAVGTATESETAIAVEVVAAGVQGIPIAFGIM